MALGDKGNDDQENIDRFASLLLTTRRELEVDKLFRASVKLVASDLHLKVGSPPIVRVHGELKPLNRPPIENEEDGQVVGADVDRAASQDF